MSSEKTKDFKAYTRMGTDALLLMCMRGMAMFLWKFWPIALIVLFRENRSETVFLRLGLFILAIAIFGIISKSITYFTTYFKVSDQCIILKSGFFNKKVKSIPLERIHTIRTKSGFFYRLVDMVSISFDSIASEDVEIELLLNQEDLTRLMHTINEEGDFVINITTDNKKEDGEPIIEGEKLHHFPYGLKDLILGATVQNPLKGLLIVFAFLFYIFNEINEFVLRHIEDMTNKIQDWYSKSDWIVLLIALTLSYIVTLIVWIGFIVVRQYGATISVTADKMRYEAGLFTKRMAFITKDKITALTIKSNYIEAILGIASVYIQQSDAVEGKKGNERIILFGWKHHESLQNDWYKAKGVLLAERTHSGFGIFWYSLLIRFLVLIVPVVGATAILFSPALWVVAPLVTAIGLVGSYLMYKHSAIAIDPHHILIYGGQYARTKTFIPIEKVESVRVSQSFVQKRTGRAKLTVNTMAGIYAVRSIPLSHADKIRNYILYKVEIHEK